MTPRLRDLPGQRGQAALETVAMLPVLIAVALAIGHVLAAEASRELAGNAAEAAAIALVHGADPRDAVAAALPDWSRDRVDVEVDGRAVSVRVRPPAAVPGLADLLATTARADAGPAADPPSPSTASVAETDRTNPAGDPDPPSRPADDPRDLAGAKRDETAAATLRESAP